MSTDLSAGPGSKRENLVFAQTRQPSLRAKAMQPQFIQASGDKCAPPSTASNIDPYSYSAPGYAPQYPVQYPAEPFQQPVSEYPPQQYGAPYPPQQYPIHGYGVTPSAVYPTSCPPAGKPVDPVMFSHQNPAMPTVIVVSGQAAAPYSSAPQPEGYAERAQRIVRQGFIRKVYTLLFLQLLVTFGFVAIFTFVDQVRMGVQRNPAVLIVAIVLSLVFLFALMCFPKIAKRWPVNVLCLAGFTLTEGYLIGAIASSTGSDAVILAVGGTIFITLGLTVLTWQSKISFTALSSGILAVFMTLIFFAVVAAIAPSRILRTVFACIGVLLFSLFLVYDTQMVIGRGELKFGIDDAVNAALMLYIDIIQMFLCLLSLFGGKD